MLVIVQFKLYIRNGLMIRSEKILEFPIEWVEFWHFFKIAVVYTWQILLNILLLSLKMLKTQGMKIVTLDVFLFLFFFIEIYFANYFWRPIFILLA